MWLKDEAYELWRQWSLIYEPESSSRSLIHDLMDELMLVNVVHNDYKSQEAIFEPFFRAGEQYSATHPNDAVVLPNETEHLLHNGDAITHESGTA